MQRNVVKLEEIEKRAKKALQNKKEEIEEMEKRAKKALQEADDEYFDAEYNVRLYYRKINILKDNLKKMKITESRVKTRSR